MYSPRLGSGVRLLGRVFGRVFFCLGSVFRPSWPCIGRLRCAFGLSLLPLHLCTYWDILVSLLVRGFCGSAFCNRALSCYNTYLSQKKKLLTIHVRMRGGVAGLSFFLVHSLDLTSYCSCSNLRCCCYVPFS